MVQGTTGIETVYAGTTFRSRAEARWAAFSDVVGWRWDYEPLDLAGYIPDFVLQLQRPTILEVKGSATTLVELEDHKAKIERSGWVGEAIIVGASPHGDRYADHECPTQPRIGLLAERDHGAWVWSKCILFRCYQCHGVSVLSEDGSWRCRRAGCQLGNAHVGHLEEGELGELWAEANRKTRWMPKRNP
jgi:hypothetical protein